MPKRARAPALAGKTVAIFLDHKAEDMEIVYPKFRLEEEGANIVVVGSHPAGTTYAGKAAQVALLVQVGQ